MRVFALLVILLFFADANPVWARQKKSTPFKGRRSSKQFRKSKVAAPSKNKALHKKRTRKARRIASIRVSEKRVGSNRRVHRYRANLGIGLNVVSDTGAMNIAGQLGYAFWDDNRFYVGPDLSFALNGPSSLLLVMAGGWYEFRFKQAPRMGVAMGLSTGVAVSDTFPDVGATELVLLGDFALTQEISDLASVRGQVRPGWVGSNFAFAMNFSVGFRFP